MCYATVSGTEEGARRPVAKDEARGREEEAAGDGGEEEEGGAGEAAAPQGGGEEEGGPGPQGQALEGLWRRWRDSG